MSFASDTVHGLSADVYFGGTQLRVLGEVTIGIAPETLDLTANDEGAFNPINTLRRGEAVTVGMALTDTQGLATISGVILPFSSNVSGASGIEVLLPKSQPGDDYLSKAAELRLVTRDGTATWIFPSAVVTAPEELAMAEDSQQAWSVSFRCYNATVSGVETPLRVISGSVVTGP